MKRVVSVLMLVFFLFSALPMAGAAEAVSEERIELGDGVLPDCRNIPKRCACI